MLKVTAENFTTDILQTDKVAVVDFWAEWCGPCKMFGPIFEETSQDFTERAVFAKLNVDEAQNLAFEYNVMSIPTVMIFKNGMPVKQSIGVLSKMELTELINSVI